MEGEKQRYFRESKYGQRLSITINPALYERMRAYAESRRMSISRLVRLSATQYMDGGDG